MPEEKTDSKENTKPEHKPDYLYPKPGPKPKPTPEEKHKQAEKSVTQTFSQSHWFLTEPPQYQIDVVGEQLKEELKQAIKQMGFVGQGEIAIRFGFDDRRGKFRLKAIALGKKKFIPGGPKVRIDKTPKTISEKTIERT